MGDRHRASGRMGTWGNCTHSCSVTERRSVIAGLLLAVVLGKCGWWLGTSVGWGRGWTAFAGAWLGLVLGLAVVRTGVHLPSFGGNGVFWSTCRRNPGISLRTTQELVNLLMLAPLAFGVTLASRRWWVALLVATVVIALVEVAQAMLGTGLCEVGDATRNFVGALIGVVVGCGAVTWLTRRTIDA